MQELEGRPAVQAARQSDPLLLATRQVAPVRLHNMINPQLPLAQLDSLNHLLQPLHLALPAAHNIALHSALKQHRGVFQDGGSLTLI